MSIPVSVSAFHERGYLFPLHVFDEEETAEFRRCFFAYRDQIAGRLTSLPARDQWAVFSETHTFLHWVYRMASHPRVLDAVESLLGPDLLVWNTRWFAKLPGEKTYISWHQDAAYWGLEPPNVVTAWLALTESTPENGGMRVIPGSHKERLLPQIDTYAPDNALSRGQEIAVEVNEAEAVDIVLKPGEMSLHHVAIVHGSKANQSAQPRIGVAVRLHQPGRAAVGSRTPNRHARARPGSFRPLRPGRAAGAGGEFRRRSPAFGSRAASDSEFGARCSTLKPFQYTVEHFLILIIFLDNRLGCC